MIHHVKGFGDFLQKLICKIERCVFIMRCCDLNVVNITFELLCYSCTHRVKGRYSQLRLNNS